MSAPLGGVLSYLRRLAPDGPAAEDGLLLSRFAQGDGAINRDKIEPICSPPTYVEHTPSEGGPLLAGQSN